MKHAYLILAHNEFALLQTLVSCLDDERNDIFVHIDRKVKELPDLHCERAGLTILSERVDVRWGDFSMVEAEYALFRAAGAQGPYLYYHLLSGVDLPLKSQDYIHGFFSERAGKEFIGYTLVDNTPELSRRMQRWHFFPRHFSRRRNGWSAVRALLLRIQEWLGIVRNKDVPFKKGSQWVSITDDMLRWLLEHERWVQKTFTHTFVPDECVVQTLAWSSPYRKNLYDTESDAGGCMRAIGWRGNELEDWSAEDFGQLSSSAALFARKFNSLDPAFIQKIVSLSARV